MKTLPRPTGSIRTLDAARAGEKLAHDAMKLDTNHDGVITQYDLQRGAKKLGFSKAETQALSTLISNAPKFRSGASALAVEVGAIYGGNDMSGVNTKTPGVITAKELDIFKKSDTKNAYANAVDIFEYVQATEKK